MSTTAPTSTSSRESWRYGLILFLAVLLLAVPQAALLPLLDRDEPRFAEASREMLQSGDFVVPTFDHAPRYAKPPLIYWCQLLSYTIFEENAFAARLPSLLATAGTALLVFAWGVRLGSKNIGLIAGLSYAFCFQTVQQGRVATADALLIFFMTLTVYAGWRLLEQTRVAGLTGKESWSLWGTILALGFCGGFLAKGPEALLPIIPLLFCARSAGSRVLSSLIAILLLGLFIVSWWAVPAYIQTHGDYWRVGMSEGVGERMVTGMQGHGASTFSSYLFTLPLYLLIFWLSALPWSPLLLTHGKKLFSTWKSDLLDSYLLLNAGIIFLVFSLMVTKLPHYTLPAFPFIALFVARRWILSELRPGLPLKLAGGCGIVLALLILILVPVAGVYHAMPSPMNELVRSAQGSLRPDTEFAMVDFQEPSVIWEMRRVVKGYSQVIGKTDIVSFLDQPGSHAVVLTTPLWQQIAMSANDQNSAWKIYHARGLNAAKGSLIDLTLVVKP